MPATCQRIGDLFSFGLVWQYSSVQTKYNKDRFKVIATYLQQGVPWHTQILADQLTLFQSGGTDYAHLITTGTPGFSDVPTALTSTVAIK